MNQRVYVSYAPTDGSVATQLVAALAVDPILQAWAPPTRQGDDATEVGLRRSIEAADTLIVVITAEALGSPLCELEVSTAVQCNVPVVAAVAGELTGLEPPDWLGNFPMADIRSGDCRDLVAILRKFQPAMASAGGVGTAPEGFQAAPIEDASRPLTAEDLNVFIPVEVVDTPEPQGPVGSSYQSYRTAFAPGANAAAANQPQAPPPWERSRPERPPRARWRRG